MKTIHLEYSDDRMYRVALSWNGRTLAIYEADSLITIADSMAEDYSNMAPTSQHLAELARRLPA